MQRRNYRRILRITFLLVFCSGLGAQAQDCASARAMLDRELEEIKAEKAKCRREIMNNWVCSQCKRTKSQIEAQEPVSYEAHLKEVKGVSERSPYTRQDASATLEEYYQNRVLDVESRKASLLLECGDLNNESYIEKTGQFDDDHSRVEAQVDDLSDLSAGKVAFDPTAADVLSFDNSDLTSRCNELEGEVSTLKQRVSVIKSNWSDQFTSFEEIEESLRGFGNSLRRDCNIPIIEEINAGVIDIKGKLDRMETEVAKTCEAFRSHQQTIISLADKALAQLKMFRAARLDFDKYKNEITDNALWQFAINDNSVAIGQLANAVKGATQLFWVWVPGATKYIDVTADIATKGILYSLDSDGKSKMQFAKEQIKEQLIEYNVGAMKDGAEKLVETAIEETYGLDIAPLLEHSKKLYGTYEILNQTALNAVDMSEVQLQETQRLTLEALTNYDKALIQMEKVAAIEEGKLQAYKKFAADAAGHYGARCNALSQRTRLH